MSAAFPGIRLSTVIKIMKINNKKKVKKNFFFSQLYYLLKINFFFVHK